MPCLFPCHVGVFCYVVDYKALYHFNELLCICSCKGFFKLKVVLSVINDGLSLREAEKTYNLRTKAVITNWLHQYKKDGINGLQPKKGKHRLLKQPKQIEPEQAKIDKSKTQDELLEEIAYLRAEVALLKKRRALRLESEAGAQKHLLKSSRN